ncbi:MAG TPA: hypothetical protein VLV55_07405 [Rhizomicrobium sp.]|nr:hypothetical protein [Rhizomicrobium sp.]
MFGDPKPIEKIWFMGYVPANWKGWAFSIGLILAFNGYFFCAGALGLISTHFDWIALGFVWFVWLPFACVAVRHTEMR